MSQQAMRSVVTATLSLAGVAIAIAISACGADSDCPTEVYFAANVTVVGADDYSVQSRLGAGEFVDCYINQPDAGSVGLGTAQCGAGDVGTLEIRATAADGRTASTTIMAQERSNQCGPLTQDVVLDLSI